MSGPNNLVVLRFRPLASIARGIRKPRMVELVAACLGSRVSAALATEVRENTETFYPPDLTDPEAMAEFRSAVQSRLQGIPPAGTVVLDLMYGSKISRVAKLLDLVAQALGACELEFSRGLRVLLLRPRAAVGLDSLTQLLNRESFAQGLLLMTKDGSAPVSSAEKWPALTEISRIVRESREDELESASDYVVRSRGVYEVHTQPGMYSNFRFDLRDGEPIRRLIAEKIDGFDIVLFDDVAATWMDQLIVGACVKAGVEQYPLSEFQHGHENPDRFVPTVRGAAEAALAKPARRVLVVLPLVKTAVRISRLRDLLSPFDLRSLEFFSIFFDAAETAEVDLVNKRGLLRAGVDIPISWLFPVSQVRWRRQDWPVRAAIAMDDLISEEPTPANVSVSGLWTLLAEIGSIERDGQPHPDLSKVDAKDVYWLARGLLYDILPNLFDDPEKVIKDNELLVLVPTEGQLSSRIAEVLERQFHVAIAEIPPRVIENPDELSSNLRRAMKSLVWDHLAIIDEAATDLRRIDALSTVLHDVFQRKPLRTTVVFDLPTVQEDRRAGAVALSALYSWRVA